MSEWKFVAEDFAKNGQLLFGSGAAHVANQKLAEWTASSPVVTGHKAGQMWYTGDELRDCDTHVARLIQIEPIVRDSFESLLREFLRIREDNLPTGNRLQDVADRARRLLEPK